MEAAKANNLNSAINYAAILVWFIMIVLFYVVQGGYKVIP